MEENREEVQGLGTAHRTSFVVADPRVDPHSGMWAPEGVPWANRTCRQGQVPHLRGEEPVPTRLICCIDLSTHLAIRHVVDDRGGFAFVTFENQRRMLVPIHHCPWCGTELQKKADRPFDLSHSAYYI